MFTRSTKPLRTTIIRIGVHGHRNGRQPAIQVHQPLGVHFIVTVSSGHQPPLITTAPGHRHVGIDRTQSSASSSRNKSGQSDWVRRQRPRRRRSSSPDKFDPDLDGGHHYHHHHYTGVTTSGTGGTYRTDFFNVKPDYTSQVTSELQSPGNKQTDTDSVIKSRSLSPVDNDDSLTYSRHQHHHHHRHYVHTDQYHYGVHTNRVKSRHRQTPNVGQELDWCSPGPSPPMPLTGQRSTVIGHHRQGHHHTDRCRPGIRTPSPPPYRTDLGSTPGRHVAAASAYTVKSSQRPRQDSELT